MTNSKKRRLAKFRLGGPKGEPSPIGNRAARRHPAPTISLPRWSGKTSLYAGQAPAPEAAVGAAAE